MRKESADGYEIYEPESMDELVLALSGRSGFGLDLFRGQARSEWALVSSLGRAAEQEDHDVWWWEEVLLEKFMRYASTHLGSVRPDESQVVEWLVMMQHYGAPTRMLDWSRSALIALFFAVNGSYPNPDDETGSAAVWTMSKPEVPTLEMPSPYDGQRIHLDPVENTQPVSLIDWQDAAFRSAIEENSPVPLLIDPLAPDARMLAQQGVLTALCGLSASLDPDAARAAQPRFELRKLLVPRIWTYDIHLFLDTAGLSNTALFPGLDGVGRSVRHDIELTVRGVKHDYL